MNRLPLIMAASLVVTGCAADPKQTMLTFDTQSVAYSTPECQSAREAALAYNDRTLGRAGMGMALGLLGPVGLIGAVAIDANQNNERRMLNDIMRRDCGDGE